MVSLIKVRNVSSVRCVLKEGDLGTVSRVGLGLDNNLRSLDSFARFEVRPKYCLS
jgi:hypothetical protein